MNTAITKIDSDELRTITRQLRKLNWKQRSLLAAGVAVTGYTLSRINPLTLLAGGVVAFGVAQLASRDPSIREKMDRLVSLDGGPLEQIVRTVRIRNAGTQELYGLASDFSMLPLFVPAIKLVNEISGDRSIWTMKSGMLTVMLDAEITSRLEGKLIAFTLSYHGSKVGDVTVSFELTGDGTAATVTLQYNAFLGKLVDKALRPILINEADTFLLKLKQLAETGEIARIK